MAHAPWCYGHGATRFVDVDDQDMTGVGLDVIEVGDFRRTGVPDPTGVANLGERMLVAQRHVVQRAAGQRLVQPGQPNQRRFVAIGVEYVDAAVRDQHADGRAGGQVFEDVGDQIGGRGLGPPRRGDDLESRPNLMNPGPIQHPDVVRAFGGEQRTGVRRRRIQRIVIARQQVDRNTDGAHGLQGLTDHLRGQLVVFEDVTRDHDELRTHLGGQRTQAGHGVAPGGRIPRLGIPGEEVSGHAQLPVGGVQESHPGPPFRRCMAIRATRV